jgi:hypothetical protein
MTGSTASIFVTPVCLSNEAPVPQLIDDAKQVDKADFVPIYKCIVLNSLNNKNQISQPHIQSN